MAEKGCCWHLVGGGQGCSSTSDGAQDSPRVKLQGMWQPGWEGCLGENGFMHIYGWVPFPKPETITILLVGHIPIQN